MKHFLHLARPVHAPKLAVSRFSLSLVVLLLLAGGQAWGQTTIGVQDFETSPATPTWAITAGATKISTSTGSGDTPASQRIRSGAKSWQQNNGTATLDLDAISTAGWTNVSVIVRISSTSTSTGNGADGGDYLRLYVAKDGAAYPTTPSASNADIAVAGANNARWGYNNTLNATTTAGTNLQVAGTGNATGGATNAGTIYSTLKINIQDGTNSVALRLIAFNDASGEVWNVDDIVIQGTPPTPTTTSISPTTVTAGSGDFTLTVNGTNFISGLSAITLGGTALTTTFVSSTQLTATVAAAAIASAGTPAVGVTTTGAASVSGTQTLTVQASGAPTLSAGALSAGFGNVCLNTTPAAQNFTITGSDLTSADVTVSGDAAYTFATTAGGTYSNPLTITQAGCTGGSCFSQMVYVKFTPTAVASYSGNITVAGGGAASSATTSVTGAGINTAPTAGSPTSATIGTITAILGGNITDLGCSSVTERGIEYSTSTGFANGTGTKISETAGAPYATGVYTVNVSGLSANTQYYYKALAVSSNGTGYSTEASFYTLSMPATAQPTTFSATAGAAGSLNLSWDAATFPASGATAAGYLLVYATGTPTLVGSPNGLAPASTISVGTIAATTATTLPTLPATTASVTGLTAGQAYNFLLIPYTYNGSAAATYHYLTTSPLTTSGTPIGLPSITNVAASSITAVGATAGGTSLNANGGTVSAKGVVWNTSANPTIASNLGLTNEGASTANFSSTISGLSAQTQYNYRAYITTEAGTSYGSNLTFRTLSNPPTTAPTGLTATAYGATDITLDWTAATYPGTGATATGYILLQRTDGTFPTASGVVSGTAPGSLSLPAGTTLAATVTSGATTSQTIKGLNALSAYHFLLVPYTWNNSQAATYNYLTISAPTVTATTMATPWENFEAAASIGYTTANVTISGRSWTLGDVLIDGTGSDFYNGTKGTRIRSSLGMNFNKSQGMGTVMLYHGMFGTDADATWQLEASTNNGSTWTAYVSPTYTATNSTFALQTIPVNLQGNVRFRIVKVSGGTRINIDDIYVTDFVLTTGTVTISDCHTASVPFTYTVGPFSGATFTAQLSDASGSFASPVAIGTLASNNSGSQTIAATLPTNRVYGTGYRIRVVAGPAATGTDNGTNLTIYAPLIVSAGADQTVCGATTVNATVSGGKTPYTYDWNGGASANATYSVAAPAPGVPATYDLDVMDDLGCLLPDDVVVTYGAPTTIPTVQGTYSATAGIADGSWTHYCDCPNNLRLLSLEHNSWAPGTLVAGTPAAGEYAVRVDVAPATTSPAYTPSAPTPVSITAPYVQYAGWKVMNRTWDVALNNAGQEPVSAVGVRSYYTTADFDAVRGATTGIGAGEHTKLTFYKLKDLGTTSAAALAGGHSAVTAAKFIEFNLTANPAAWTYTSAGNNIHQAEYQVNEFSGGGGGGAPNGTGAFPVEMVSFTGTPAANAIQLEWTTASEQNSALFVIEHSADNAVFEAIGELSAAGNSSSLRSYAFTDISPVTGTNYYRLRQFDTDGTAHLSNTLEVAYAPGQAMLSLAPNPAVAGQRLSIFGGDATQEITLTLSTPEGKEVSRMALPIGVRAATVPVLPAGVYLYALMQNGITIRGRMVVE